MVGYAHRNIRDITKLHICHGSHRRNGVWSATTYTQTPFSTLFPPHSPASTTTSVPPPPRPPLTCSPRTHPYPSRRTVRLPPETPPCRAAGLSGRSLREPRQQDNAARKEGKRLGRGESTIHNRHACAFSARGNLIIHRPRDNERDSGEEARCSGEQQRIPQRRRLDAQHAQQCETYTSTSISITSPSPLPFYTRLDAAELR